MWEHIHSPDLMKRLEKSIILPEDAKSPVIEFIKYLSSQQFSCDLYVVIGMGNVSLTTADYERSSHLSHDTIYLTYTHDRYVMSYHHGQHNTTTGTLEANSISDALSKIELYLLQLQFNQEEEHRAEGEHQNGNTDKQAEKASS